MNYFLADFLATLESIIDIDFVLPSGIITSSTAEPSTKALSHLK